MARVQDLVCAMMIESDTASERTFFEGTTYYFCSAGCRGRFEEDPARFVDESQRNAPDRELEQHEPPYTSTGGLVAPKFGSAGSGGLEYERLSEAHDDR